MSETPASRQNRLIAGLCLLLALALAGGTIGTWVYRSIRQQGAVAELDHLNSSGPWTVLYDFETNEDFDWLVDTPPPGPAWLRDRLGIDFVATVRSVQANARDAVAPLENLPGVRSLALFNDEMTDAEMDQLRPLTQLEKLDLVRTQVTDDGLAVLASLPHLKTLRLYSCDRITGAGFDQLGKIAGLRRLSLLGNRRVTNAGLVKLSRLIGLETLGIEFGADSSDAVLEQLAALPSLRRLELGYTTQLHCGDGLQYLGGFASLEELSLQGRGALSEQMLAKLPVLPGLKSFELAQSWLVAADGLANLEKFPSLERLTLFDVAHLDDAALARLERLPKLRELTIDACNGEITDEGLAAIARLTSLKKLWLRAWPDLTDAGLARLADLHSLEQLSVEGDFARVSPTIWQDLKRRLPKCHIQYQKPGSPPTEL